MYAMKGILDVDVTNALQVTEDIHIVSHVHAVELVALILTRVRVIVRARYDIEIVPFFLLHLLQVKNVVEYCNGDKVYY